MGQLKDMGRSCYKSTFVQRAMLLLGIYLCYSILTLKYTKLIFIRDSLFSIVKQLDPVGLERRTRDLN